MIKKIREYLTPKGYLVGLYLLGFTDVVTILCPDGELVTTAFDSLTFAASAYTEAIDLYS